MKWRSAIVLTWLAGVASAAFAFPVTGKVTCIFDEGGLVDATLVVSGNVDAGHYGMPGLIYVALHDKTTDRGYVYDLYQTWSEWGGGLLPVYAVVRDGLGAMSFKANVTPYVLSGTHALYVGYGVLTPEMERKVDVRRQAIERAKAMGRTFRDDGDDHLRRALIEGDMRKAGRYIEVLAALRCN